MTGPEHVRAAEEYVARAYHYIYGDGADPQTGLGFAAMAQVHATLAQTAATMESVGAAVNGVVRPGWVEVFS